METNSERLDRIENDGQGLSDADFEWLIQQAGRTQTLEEVNQKIAIDIMAGRRQFERYRQALHFYGYDNGDDEGETARNALMGKS